MIEIIKEKIKMPPSDQWRYQYEPVNKNLGGRGKWQVIDTHEQNKVVLIRDYQTCAIARFNMNKKYYWELQNIKQPVQ